jgi:antitoxin CcdA
MSTTAFQPDHHITPAELFAIPHAGDAEEEALIQARALGVDADAVFRAALIRAIAEAKAQRWQEENRKAIEAHAEWVARHGVPLAKTRVW